MTRVPLAAPVVGGLLNMRGQIVTAIDLRRWLDLSDRPADQPAVNLILRTADGGVSLLVDRSATCWRSTRTISSAARDAARPVA